MKLEPTQPASPTSSFSLASLLLLMTLLSVSFGLFSVAPWIGVPFWIITQTAWLSTLDITQQWAGRGFFPNNNVRLGLFFRWCMLVTLFLIFVCAGAAGGVVTLLLLINVLEPQNSGSVVVDVSLLASCAATAGAVVAIFKLVQLGIRHRSRDIEMAGSHTADANDLARERQVSRQVVHGN